MIPAGDPYSRAVRDLFRDTAHAGQLEAARRARRDAQGVAVELSMRPENGTIDALSFRAYGCPHLIAACEAFCRAWEGRAVAELSAFRAVELVRELSIPVEKTGRILVLEDAVRLLA